MLSCGASDFVMCALVMGLEELSSCEYRTLGTGVIKTYYQCVIPILCCNSAAIEPPVITTSDNVIKELCLLIRTTKIVCCGYCNQQAISALSE